MDHICGLLRLMCAMVQWENVARQIKIKKTHQKSPRMANTKMEKDKTKLSVPQGGGGLLFCFTCTWGGCACCSPYELQSPSREVQ